ncbi:MAG TPA: L,D-transpeptidase [Actinospica sp.]|nr:L,D-transpeptidase [Actinospica sp.]
MSGFRRSMPYLAAGTAAAAVVLTAALAGGAAGTPKSATVDNAAGIAAAAGAASASARAAAPAAVSASVSASASAAESAAAASAAASASAAAADQAAAADKASESASAQQTLDAENAALRAAGVPCDTDAVACVSLSRQKAWLLHDGKVVYGPVRVATGRASLPTPAGDFHVWYKVVDGWSTTYNAPMPYSVFFYKGDAFHEDPVTVRSHGCVHLSLKNAEYFYRFLQYGDLVEVRN